MKDLEIESTKEQFKVKLMCDVPDKLVIFLVSIHFYGYRCKQRLVLIFLLND